jgi:tRNA(Ile)-lysidine synthase
LEDLCREARLSFFKELIQKEGYAAVLLGHHGDDQAELILKRIFEGSPLTALRGMPFIAQHGEISLWRPLLNVKKSDLEEWLHSKGKSGFHDETNLSSRFLKGRMRTTLLPFLSKEFGKEVSPRLLKWGKEADELQSFIKEATAPLEKWVARSPGQITFDMGGRRVHPFLLKQFIRQLTGELGLKIAEKGVDTAVSLLQSSAIHKEICITGGVLFIDRGKLRIQTSGGKLPSGISIEIETE